MAGFDGFKLPVSRRTARQRRPAESLRAPIAFRGHRPSRDGTSELLAASDQAAARTDAVDSVDGSSKRGAAASAAGVRLPDRIPFSKTDILFVGFSIVTFLADIGTDVKLAHSYYAHGDWLFFGLTLGFFVLSGVVSSAFSMYWYVYDHRATRVHLASDELPSKGAWFLRTLCAILLIAPVLRHIDIIRYGLKSRWGKRSPEQRERYFREMQYERVDGAMLRLFECFVEDAPQLVLQLYVVLSKGFPSSTDKVTWTFVFQAASIVTSLISLAWGLVAYHKALRYSRVDRCVLSHTGFVLQFFWRLFEVAPRVLAFAVFMLAHQYWLGVLVGCHWVAMAAWLLAMGSKFCPRLKLELLFVLVVAAVWVFCHFNIKDGATRRRYVIYYTIVYLENAVMAALWYASVDGAPLATRWHKDIVLPIILCSFWVGIFFMLIYYYYFHPNRPLPITRPCSFWLVCDGSSRSSTQQSHDYVDGKKGPPSAHMLSEIAVTIQPADATEKHLNGVDAAGEAAYADDAFTADTSALLPPQSPMASNDAVAEGYIDIAPLSTVLTQRPSSICQAAADDVPLPAAIGGAAGDSASRLLGSRPALEPFVFEPVAEAAAAMVVVVTSQPPESDDTVYLKPLPDGIYVEPMDNRPQPVDGDDGSSPVPPAYEAPGLPTVAVAEDNDVPVYRAPALPGTAAADDLSDLPAYHAPVAPPRPWSAAIDLDDRVGDEFRPTARRPRSAVVDMRYSDRPPLLVALPSAAAVVSRPRGTDALLASFDSRARGGLAEATITSAADRESSPSAAAALQECKPRDAAAAALQPTSLLMTSAASSPAAPDNDSAEERSLLSPPAAERSACSSVAGDRLVDADDGIVSSICLADATADYLEQHLSTPVSVDRQSSPVRDDLSLQTPDLRQHDFDRGDLLSRRRYDNELLLTPDRVRLAMGSGTCETPSAAVHTAAGAVLHTPEARAREAAASALPLPSTPDGDLDLTPDRKLRAAGVGPIAYC